MRSTLALLATRFDYVIIDAPPILPVTDAVVLSSLVDGAIVVVGSGTVQRDQLAHSLESLESVAGRVLGLVMNRLPAKSSGSYASYRYEAPEDSATRRERKRV
jgi:Mrp family chromosome partitioning ATPase